MFLRNVWTNMQQILSFFVPKLMVASTDHFMDVASRRTET